MIVALHESFNLGNGLKSSAPDQLMTSDICFCVPSKSLPGV